ETARSFPPPPSHGRRRPRTERHRRAAGAALSSGRHRAGRRTLPWRSGKPFARHAWTRVWASAGNTRDEHTGGVGRLDHGLRFGDDRIARRDRYPGEFCLHRTDRKSTRLNSSHSQISYAVFCLKKKKKNTNNTPHVTK